MKNVKDYKLSRSYTPGRTIWTLRATLRKLMLTAEEGGNLVIECGEATGTVYFVIPIGRDSAFARDVLPFLTLDNRGSCTFDITSDYGFTWRKGVHFDGKPYAKYGPDAPVGRHA